MTSLRLIPILLLLLLLSPVAAQLPEPYNGKEPGVRFDLEENLPRMGRRTVIFFSPNSEASLEFLEAITPLLREDSENGYLLLNVDRAGAEEIDWKSPLVRQFNIKQVPYVEVYDQRVKTLSGHEARLQILNELDELNSR